jgi:hypothetical protein
MIEQTYKVTCDFCKKDLTYKECYVHEFMVSIRYIEKKWEPDKVLVSFSNYHPSKDFEKDFCDLKCLKNFLLGEK